MVATPLDAPLAFDGIGNYKFYWLDACADYTAPLRTELNAGVDLSPQVQMPNGWSTDRDKVNYTTITNGFTGQLSGYKTGADSSLEMLASSDPGTVPDIRSVHSAGDNGFIVRFEVGDVAGSFMDVFPVRVNSMVKSTDPGAVQTITANYVITLEPAENVEVPA